MTLNIPGCPGMLLGSEEPATREEADGAPLSSSSLSECQAEVARALSRLHADGDHTALNAYCAVLNQHGWMQPTIAEALQTSQQNVAQKVRRGRAWLAQYEPTFEQLYPRLPVTQGPGRAATPRKVDGTAAALNLEQVRRDAAERVDAELRAVEDKAGADDHEAILVHATHLMREAEAAKEHAAAERATMAWSLICYEGRTGIAEAGHWPPSQFTRARNEALGITSKKFGQLDAEHLAALARERGIQPQDDADRLFTEATRRIVAAASTIQRAREHRDQAIVDMAGSAGGRNTGTARIAKLAGVTSAAVTHILNRERPRSRG